MSPEEDWTRDAVDSKPKHYQLSYSSPQTEFKSHLVQLYFIAWNHYPMKEGRKLEHPKKTPDDELQKMLHTKAQKFKPEPRLEPAL